MLDRKYTQVELDFHYEEGLAECERRRSESQRIAKERTVEDILVDVVAGSFCVADMPGFALDYTSLSREQLRDIISYMVESELGHLGLDEVRDVDDLEQKGNIDFFRVLDPDENLVVNDDVRENFFRALSDAIEFCLAKNNLYAPVVRSVTANIFWKVAGITSQVRDYGRKRPSSQSL